MYAYYNTSLVQIQVWLSNLSSDSNLADAL